MDDIAISIKNVSKYFKGECVLSNINIDFLEGGIYGLIGRNGSGKTVLLKCICGFFPSTTGEIKVWDKVIGKDTDFAENMGFIINSPGFLPNVSGYKNLKYLSSISRLVDNRRIRECMNLVGLDPDSRKKVRKYSLGMTQRLGIAQAIMENPKLIILDEPMNGLDEQGVKDIRKLLLNLKKEGKTIILTSHSREDIQVLCDDVFKMDAGNLTKYKITP